MKWYRERAKFWIVLLIAGLPVVAAAQTVSGTFKVVCVADPNVIADLQGVGDIRTKDITHEKACLHHTPQLTWQDTVTLVVQHTDQASFDDSDEPNPAELVLFLEGKPLHGTNASVGVSQTDEDDATNTLLAYRIQQDLTTAAARKNWKEVLTAASAPRSLAISTGLENGPAAQSSAKVDFVVMRTSRLVWWFLLALAGIVIFIVIASYTGALRDKEPAGGITDASDRAYSLSRVQMAFWTMLVIYAYLYIWLLTGEYNVTIPASVLGLMGITLATFGAAGAVDKSKVQTNQEKLQINQKKLEGLSQTRTAAPADSTLKTQEETLKAQNALLQPRTVVCRSEGFWKDITTSADGAGLHRLQLMVWTLALAVVFLMNVKRTLAMPDFDATLLGLMGIASGTYVGLKVPENKC